MYSVADVLGAHAPTLVCGHRGMPIRAVENTLASFEEALREGAALVEFDVRVAGGGEVVVFHDRTLRRLLGDARPLADVGVAGLKALRFVAAPGDVGVAVPTLEEALARLKGRCVPLVEVKEEEAVPGVLAVLDGLGMRDAVMVQSFLPQAVRALSGAGLAAGLLVDHVLPTGQPPTCEQVQEAAAAVGARFVGLAQTLPDEAWMRALERQGLPVAVWTVNAPDDMRRVLSLSPRVLITDDTSAAQARLGRGSLASPL